GVPVAVMVSPCPHGGVPMLVTVPMVVTVSPWAGRKDKAVDPVEWSVRDVVEYFTEAGFPEQAGAFQEQEIDGKSLLLMQRADVLTGLSIRLGPALKIYEYHVKLLQRVHSS
uniref:SAM domain-containing protein n=1 Tax=Zosterops lateralis melanops TaxID=1220523 RepID=A0A8D2QLD1_ZOSLA